MNKKYRVSLSADQRAHLLTLLASGQQHVRVVKRAQMLLKADEHAAGANWSGDAISRALDVHPMTVVGVRRRYVEHGLDAVLYGRYAGHTPAIVTGEVEAHLIALSCSTPPSGREHWTMQLLADKLVELCVVEHISDETVRQTLKKRAQTVAEAPMVHSTDRKRCVCEPDGRHSGRVSRRV
jgi:transposase